MLYWTLLSRLLCCNVILIDQCRQTNSFVPTTQAQLHALEDGIASREAHIATLSTSEREARSTAAAYAARVSELESAIRVREGEACQLRAALVCSEQQVDSVVGTEAAQREVQRLQYEIRLKVCQYCNERFSNLCTFKT